MIRGSDAVEYASASSFTVVFPAGSLAGDTALIQVCAAYDITAPTGWTQLYLLNGTVWNAYIGWKILTSGDISTGSVTVSAAGSFNGSSNIVVFAGAVVMREFQSSQVGGFLGNWTTSGAVLASDLGIVFGSNRGLTTMPTVTSGTLLDSALNGTYPSAVFSIPMAAGANTVVTNMSGAPQWEGALVVTEASSGGGAVSITCSILISGGGGGSGPSTLTCSIGIGYGGLATTCGSPPAATVGIGGFVYRPPVTMGSVTLSPIYDLNGTLTWDVSSLPPGLSWDGNPSSSTYGNIVGTPTLAGTYFYDYTVASPDGQRISNSCLLIVNPGAPGTGPSSIVACSIVIAPADSGEAPCPPDAIGGQG